MKNSLVNKIVDGAKEIGKKVILPLTFVAGSYIASGQTADAQRKDFPKNMDYGASFSDVKEYASQFNGAVEEKVFYNKHTGKTERYYIVDVDKSKYKDDLDIGGLEFYSTTPLANAATGKMTLKADSGMYFFRPAKTEDGKILNHLSISDSHIADWCENQIREKAGASEGTNYISISDVRNLFANLPGNPILHLGNGLDLLVMTVPKNKLDRRGKMNQYFVPLDKNHEIGFNPQTKEMEVYGPVFLPAREEKKEGKVEPVSVEVGGLAASNAEHDSTYTQTETEGKQKAPRESTLYLIGGFNTTPDFNLMQGEAGVQFGHIGLVGNFGKMRDETTEYTTDPSPNGVSFSNTESKKNITLKGIGVEAHPFLKSKRLAPFVGVALNNWDYTLDKRISTIKDGKTIKTNPSSEVISESSLNTYVGLEAKFKNSKLGLKAGHDNKTGFNGGVRYSIRLAR